MFSLRSLRLVRPSITIKPIQPRFFSITPALYKTNTSTRTKENVTDLETFFKLIGRDTLEHLDTFEGDLSKFLKTSSKEFKNLGIDISTRRYMLRWIHKFENNLEPLREHKKGKKKHGGERNKVSVLAKKNALSRLEEKDRLKQNELDAESRGDRVF